MLQLASSPRTASLLAAALLCATLPARATDYTITLMAQERVPPKWLMRNGHADGYCPELLAAIERSEPRLHFKGLDNVRSLLVMEAGLASGTVQAACSILDTPQRRSIAQVVGKPLYLLRHRLAAAADDKAVVNSLADLARLKAIVNTTRGAAFVGQLKALGIAVDDSTGDAMVNLKKTLAGHGRFTYMSEQPLLSYMATPELRGKLRMLPVVLREEPSYFWMSRKADPEAVRLVEHALASLRASGELARIYARWMRAADPDLSPASAP